MSSALGEWPAATEKLVRVQTSTAQLEGSLCIPTEATGLVLFVHGSGSSRHSPRNRYVAGILNKVGLATLLFDLLTEREEAIDVCTRRLRFDMALLAQRVTETTMWLLQQAGTSHMNVGYFGASTGAGAAILAASTAPEFVGAVVSRGGRPDLAGEALSIIQVPTLLIVGAMDTPVVELNREAFQSINAAKSLAIIPGANHLFDEPGKLEIVAELATDWFSRYLPKLANLG